MAKASTSVHGDVVTVRAGDALLIFLLSCILHKVGEGYKLAVMEPAIKSPSRYVLNFSILNSEKQTSPHNYQNTRIEEKCRAKQIVRILSAGLLFGQFSLSDTTTLIDSKMLLNNYFQSSQVASPQYKDVHGGALHDGSWTSSIIGSKYSGKSPRELTQTYV